MTWPNSKNRPYPGAVRISGYFSLIGALLLLSACSGGEKGLVCQGNIQTLDGRLQGNITGNVVDRFTSFSVTLPKFTLNSGPLHSVDRQRYVPSAVTHDGWLALRLSDSRFMIVNAPQDKVLTFSCPSRAI